MGTRQQTKDPPSEYLREALDYNPETGLFAWKHDRPMSHFNSAKGYAVWKKRFAGKPTGYTHPVTGYVVINISGRIHFAHRIGFAMMNGDQEPGIVVDHKNGSKGDNRFANLRAATKSENFCNSGTQKNSSSGLKGVTKLGSGKFMSRIMKDGVSHYLGTFDTKGVAAVARAKAAVRIHGKFAKFS